MPSLGSGGTTDPAHSLLRFQRHPVNTIIRIPSYLPRSSSAYARSRGCNDTLFASVLVFIRPLPMSCEDTASVDVSP